VNTFKTALLQLIPSEKPDENLGKGIKYCKLAKEMGADLALFPEMWNTGYSLLPWVEGDIKKLSENAIDLFNNPLSFYVFIICG
jgi:predicted amidohydrolase